MKFIELKIINKLGEEVKESFDVKKIVSYSKSSGYRTELWYREKSFMYKEYIVVETPEEIIKLINKED